jgi:hypothetical protein
LASKVEENPIHDHRKLIDLAKVVGKCLYDEREVDLKAGLALFTTLFCSQNTFN